MTAMFCICTTNVHVSVAARVCPDLACVRKEQSLIIKEITVRSFHVPIISLQVPKTQCVMCMREVIDVCFRSDTNKP